MLRKPDFRISNENDENRFKIINANIALKKLQSDIKKVATLF